MEIIRMEINEIKDGVTQEMVYNDLELLDEIASKIIESNRETTSLPTNRDIKLLLTFVKTYLAVSSTFKDMVSEYQKTKDSETFRNKIIDREIKGLTGYIEMLDVGKITEKPTDLQILKIQIKSTLEITVKVLEKLKDTYRKNENTLCIEM